MDERMRKVEGEVNVLKDWRSKTVDPHINDSKDFITEMKEFVTIYKAEAKLRAKLDDDRHNSNAMKMNTMLVIGTGALILLGILSAILAYAALRAQPLPSKALFQLHASTPHTVLAEDAVIPPLAR